MNSAHAISLRSAESQSEELWKMSFTKVSRATSLRLQSGISSPADPG